MAQQALLEVKINGETAMALYDGRHAGDSSAAFFF
jgi:hypothetical protein